MKIFECLIEAHAPLRLVSREVFVEFMTISPIKCP